MRLFPLERPCPDLMEHGRTESFIIYKNRRHIMANIKSAKKRILVNQTKADRNKAIRSGVKTSIKKVFAAIEGGDKAVATDTLKAAISAIEKATSKGVYHKNCASRKVSRLTKAVNRM